MDKKNPNFMNFENFLNIDIKFTENGWFWVSLSVVVLLKYEVWVWAVLTLCQYGMSTDTVSVSVYTKKYVHELKQQINM